MDLNKKGQNSTIGVIIAVVLGIALLVFLIWGFSTNWTMFRNTSGAYGGQSNLDIVAQACEVKCEQVDEFCNVKKTVSYADGDKVKSEQLTCGQIKENWPLKVSCSTNCPKCSATDKVYASRCNLDNKAACEGVKEEDVAICVWA